MMTERSRRAAQVDPSSSVPSDIDRDYFFVRPRSVRRTLLKQALAKLALVVVVGLCMAMPGAAHSQEIGGHFPPTDEAANQPEFWQFREDVIAAIEAQDKTKFILCLAPQVEHRVQDSAFGAVVLEDIWEVRSDLASILRLGGKFAGNQVFVAPYTAGAALSKSENEQATTAVITGVDVPVYESPDAQSRILARLTHVIVGVVDDVEALQERYGVDLETELRTWEVVELERGAVDFVRKETRMSAARPFVQFEKKGRQMDDNDRGCLSTVDLYDCLAVPVVFGEQVEA